MEGDVVRVPIDMSGIPNLKKFGPKEPRHPTVGGLCLLCGETFRIADYTSILPLGPGSDEDAQELCRAGRPFHGIGMEVHWTCGTGRPNVDIVIAN